MTQTTMDHPSAEIAFILGITPRSGTNYLQSLLCLHPTCKPSPVPEDYFADCSNHLQNLQNSLETKWKSSWGKHLDWKEFDTLPWLGDGLSRMLLRNSPEKNITVAKTPNPNGAQNLKRIFPLSKIIFLVRDGRDAVESASRGIGWTIENAARRWVEGAKKIREATVQNDRRSIVVRYEDLVEKSEETLRSVFAFLGLAVDLYDFNQARSLPVRGSSTFGRSNDSKLNWNPVASDQSFKPIGQWQGWNRETEAKFWTIAGQEMTSLGYQRKIPTVKDSPSPISLPPSPPLRQLPPIKAGKAPAANTRVIPTKTPLKIATPRVAVSHVVTAKAQPLQPALPQISIQIDSPRSRSLVVVSTCPRRDGVDYLPGTLERLDAAGAKDLQKIVMSNGPLLSKCAWPTQFNETPRSTRTNLWAAVRKAIELRVDKLIYFEDDIETCKNTVSYMAAIPNPNTIGLITFHDMKEMPPKSENGIYVVPAKGRNQRGFWGLQAVIFPRWTLAYLVTKDPFSLWTQNPSGNGDQVIGELLSQSPWPRFAVHIPCLVNHLGEVSVAHPTHGLKPGRIPTNWPGAGFDAASITRQSVVDLTNPFRRAAARSTAR